MPARAACTTRRGAVTQQPRNAAIHKLKESNGVQTTTTSTKKGSKRFKALQDDNLYIQGGWIKAMGSLFG
jgi:hypothetical protein